MSTQPEPIKFRRDQDIANRRVEMISVANTAMLTVMHGALTRITEAELSLNGGIAVKAIAEDALIAVHTIAAALREVPNA